MHRYRLSYQQYSIDNLSDAFGSRIPLNESDIFAGKRYIYIYIHLYWRRNCIVRTSSAQRAYQQSVSRHARVRDRMLAATDAHRYRTDLPVLPGKCLDFSPGSFNWTAEIGGLPFFLSASREGNG